MKDHSVLLVVVVALVVTCVHGFTSSFVVGNGHYGTLPRTRRSVSSSSSSSSSVPTTSLAMTMERTYIMIKPDGVQRGLVGDIITRFERRGYQLCGMKTQVATEPLLQEHYKDLIDKPFFPKLQSYMLSGPVVCMIWHGKDAVMTGRQMLGTTNPLESNPGTIRGDFCIEVGRNICHGSDSVENAEREIDLWFEPSEILDWNSHSHDWIYE